MPGVAAWQAPWADKNDALDWQAYYHLRNRIVTALLHSPAEHGGALLSESLQRQLQNLLSMQYSTAALRLLAIEDVLAGPAHLHRDLLTKMRQLRELRARFTDAQDAADIESFPPPRRKAPDALKDSTTPTNKVNLLTKAAAGTAAPVRGRRARAPSSGRRWPCPTRTRPGGCWPGWTAPLVSAADGTSASWYRRDRKHVPLARLAQRGPARPAAAAVAAAGRGVPRRGGRVHLAREVAGDLRGVP